MGQDERPHRIIIDRSYSAFLPAIVRRMEEDDGAPRPRVTLEGAALAEAGELIAWAAILFEKILISAEFGTSLARSVGDRDWFWDIFEIYNPDVIVFDDEALIARLVQRSVENDLDNRELSRIIRSKFPRYYHSKDARKGLLYDIHKTLRCAEILDAAILPAPDKWHVYRHKLRSSEALLSEESPTGTAVRAVMEFHAPSVNLAGSDALFRMRQDRRLGSLRDYLWRLAGETSDTEELRRRLIREQAELINGLRVQPGSRLWRWLATSQLPFPLDAAAEAAFAGWDSARSRQHSWRFLLAGQEAYANDGI